MNYLLIALLLYIIWRVVMGFSGSKKKSIRTGGESAGQLPSEELVQDPVCGVYIPKSDAIKVKKHGEVFYFCGKECRRKFWGKS